MSNLDRELLFQKHLHTYLQDCFAADNVYSHDIDSASNQRKRARFDASVALQKAVSVDGLNDEWQAWLTRQREQSETK